MEMARYSQQRQRRLRAPAMALRGFGVMVVAAALMAGAGSAALADDDPPTSAEQQVTMVAPKFDSFAEIAISGPDPTLVAFPWSPGLSSGITYAVRTSETNLNITGRLDANIPGGATLQAIMDAPPGAVALA